MITSYLRVILERARDIWFHSCVVCLCLSHHPFPVWSAGNPWLLILLERKPRKVSDWSQLSPAGAALHPFRGVAQPPHAAGGRTQPHRGSLCSGPYRWMTFFFLSPPTLIPKRNGKTKTKKQEREIHIIIIIIQYFFKRLLHPKEGSETMLPKRVTTCVCARGQQWMFPPASPPFPTASAPRTFQRKETHHLQPSHCPSWGRGHSH